MIREGATEAQADELAAGALPALKPILVAVDSEVEALVRSARASIARLNLELRAVVHEAEVAERAAGGLDYAADAVDLREAREILRSALEPRIARRRAELASEVERARSRATQRVRSAKAETAAAVVAAREELLATLLSSKAPMGWKLPDIPIPVDDTSWSGILDDEADLDEPSADAFDDIWADDDLYDPSARTPEASVAVDSPFALPPLVARTTVPPAPVPPIAAFAVAPPVFSAPIVAPAPPFRPPPPVFSAPVVAPAAPFRPPPPIVAPAPPVVPPIPAPVAPLAAPVPPPVAAAPAPPVVAVAPVNAAPPIVLPLPPEPKPGRSALGRFMHPDILLPLIAVVIVAIVLLAWLA